MPTPCSGNNKEHKGFGHPVEDPDPRKRSLLPPLLLLVGLFAKRGGCGADVDMILELDAKESVVVVVVDSPTGASDAEANGR